MTRYFYPPALSDKNQAMQDEHRALLEKYVGNVVQSSLWDYCDVAVPYDFLYLLLHSHTRTPNAHSISRHNTIHGGIEWTGSRAIDIHDRRLYVYHKIVASTPGFPVWV